MATLRYGRRDTEGRQLMAAGVTLNREEAANITHIAADNTADAVTSHYDNITLRHIRYDSHIR